MPTSVQLPDGNIGEFPDGMSSAQIEAVLQKQFPANTAKPEGFLESLGHTFGIGKEEGEARQKEFREHPVRTLAGALIGGPALMAGKGVVDESMRSGKEVGAAINAAKDKNPYAVVEHGAYAIPFVGGGIKRGVEQLGPHEVINPAEVGTALGTAIQTAPLVADAAKPVTEPITASPGRVARFLTRTSPRETAELVKETQTANEAATKAHADEAQEAVNKQRDTRLKSLKKQRSAAAENQAAKSDVATQNKQAVKANEQAADVPAKRQAAFRELQGQIETAREKALKVGNEKYNAINPKLDPIEADGEKVESSLDQSLQKIKGSDTEPTILKNISKRINEGTAEPLTYRDLQGFYSELNAELSKGTLPGDVYAAYDTMHEAIGEEMQRIADSQGMGAQLTDARNYWRRMKQAFGKPYNPNDTATATMEHAAPDIARAEEEANRRRLLASFDPSIQGTFTHLDNLERGAKSLGQPKPLREILKPNPTPPSETVPRMKDANVPERPAAKTIGAEDVRANKLQSLEKKGIPGFRAFFRRGANYGLGLKTLWDAYNGRFASLPGDISFGAGLYGVGEGFVRLLQKPEVQEFLTRPTPEDLAQIPPELRGNLGPMLDAAKAKGIQVDPRLYAIAAAPQKKRVAAALTR